MPKKGRDKDKDSLVEDQDEEDPTKVKRNLTEIMEFPEIRYIRTEKFYSKEELEFYADLKKKPSKYYDMPIRGLGIKALKMSSTGLPSVDADTIQELVNGHLEKQLHGTKDPKFIQDLKKALECWLEMKRIETLMTTFIVSLIQSVNPKGRLF
jgi:uncharacterized membrane-anchored protein YjiN (DUF445 family)